MSTHPVELFYSYADTDESLCIELDKHLSLLRRDGVITAFHKHHIKVGTDWTKALNEHLNRASVILLLVSSDFIASNYCYGVEMQRAIERHEAGEARVIPIILRPVAWEDTPLGKLQSLPMNGMPITGRGWHSLDEAFLAITKSIQEIIKEINKERRFIFQKEPEAHLNENKEVLHILAEQPDVEPKKRHILIVEDSINTATILKYGFILQGYKATIATDGTDAMDFIRYANPNVILLDIAMPMMGGLEVIRQLKIDNSKIPIFVLTALSTVVSMKEDDLGVACILGKPMRPSTILQKIEAFFENPPLFKKALVENKEALVEEWRKRNSLHLTGE